MVGQLAGHLFHPGFVGTGRASGEMNAAGFQFHDKEQIESHQTTAWSRLRRSKVDAANVRGTVLVSRQNKHSA